MTMISDPQTKYRPFPAVGLSDRTWPDQIISAPPTWCSVDLRDGNQALIEPMNPERKLEMFELLVSIGFKQIEVGFPSASQADFDFVRELIEQNRIPEDVTIQVLTQSREPLIRRTFEALEGAPRAIVHFYNATAPVMRRVVFNMDCAEVIDLAVTHARLIRELAEARPDTEWTYQYSPEMYSGTELEFSRDIIDAVVETLGSTPAHKCIVNLPSTVERSTPNIFADMIEWTSRHLQRRDSVILSVHPHNDRGTGTAAAEFAMMAGIERVEGCLFGNGERTGNVDIVNLALNLYTDGVHPGLNFSDIDSIRNRVEYCNQLPVHPRHPYVGELVYTSFSGSHQDAIKKAFSARQPDELWDMPYLPIDPMDVGRSYEAVIRVNSQSGKGGVAYLLEREHGLDLPRRLQIEFSGVVQTVTDATGQEVTAAELWEIFDGEYLGEQGAYSYVSHHLVEESSSGHVDLRVQVNINGQTRALAATGRGPIEAFVSALSDELGEPVTVVDYHEHAIGGGADARAATYIEMKLGNGKALFGVGINGNIVTASLTAILSGVNRALQARRANRSAA